MLSQKSPEVHVVSEVVNFKIFLGNIPSDPLVLVCYRMLEFPPPYKKIHMISPICTVLILII